MSATYWSSQSGDVQLRLWDTDPAILVWDEFNGGSVGQRLTVDDLRKLAAAALQVADQLDPHTRPGDVHAKVLPETVRHQPNGCVTWQTQLTVISPEEAYRRNYERIFGVKP